MKISETLHWGFNKLQKTSTSAILDTEVLLGLVLKKEKEFLYTHSEKNLTKSQTRQFQKLIFQRTAYTPVAYLTGHKEFFGLNFKVNKNVLIPRPETELLVEEVAKIIMNNESRIKNKKTILIDVGTGSGCIPIAVAKNILFCHSESGALMAEEEESLSSSLRDPSTSPRHNVGAPLRMTTKNIKIFATDISAAALNIARHNAHLHQAKIKFLKGDLLFPFFHNSLFIIHNSFLIITANLPYLTSHQMKEKTIQAEPRLALYGGKDGLSLYRRLLHQIKKLNPKHASLFLEIDPSQKEKIIKIIKKILPRAEVNIKKDLAKQDRLVLINI